MNIRNNLFVYGETGERLNGIRESEIYQQSAQKIENFVINEMGNLKIAKQWGSVQLPQTEPFVKVFDTKYSFYIGVSKNNIYTFSKTLDRVLYKLSISENYHNYKMIENRLFLVGDTTKVYEFDKKTGNIGTSNFMELLKYPIKNKEETKIDVYKCYKVGDEIRVSLLGTYTNPKLRSDDGIFLFNTGVKLQRLYKQFKSSVTKENITGAVDGLTFGVLHGFFQKDGERQYLLGNRKIEFTGEANDSVYGSTYFTRINQNISGELAYGELQELKNNIIDVGMYEDRMYILHDGIFYFSQKGDYFNFKNDTKQDGPFYFRPTPIDNVFPEFYSTEVGNRLYATTSKGVYVVSAGNVFSSTSYKVYVASEIPCKDKGILIGENFFYISEDGDLKCVQVVPNQIGYESFSTVNVEKYDIAYQCESIEKLKYDDRIMLVGTKKKKGSTENSYTSLVFYQTLDFNLFRRFTITVPVPLSNLSTLNKYILSRGAGNTFIFETKNNMPKAILKLNTPGIKTEKGGSYANDYSSAVERVFVKALNEDKEAIKGMRINDKLITKIPQEDDLFSVFKSETHFPILNGYEIEVISNENDKILEILGIDTKIRVASD